MNEVRKLYNNDGCVLKEVSSNDYESWSSARTLGSTERRKEYRNLCYNFEYEWGTNIPHCAKKGVCDEDCEYMRNFKGQDMKQTVEEAAKKYSNDCRNRQLHCEPYCIVDFISGAEWQSKQSPWISVKEKAGCDTSSDCIVMVMNGDIFKAYFSSKNKWMKSNDGHYDEVIDDVVAWFPIPSFDEILEANRDVLERIKEKGD